MELPVRLHEFAAGNVRVDLCGSDIAMTEHHLNGSEVGAIFKQHCRKTMPKHVRSNVVNSSLFAILLYELPDLLAGEAGASPVHEKEGAMLCFRGFDGVQAGTF